MASNCVDKARHELTPHIRVRIKLPTCHQTSGGRASSRTFATQARDASDHGRGEEPDRLRRPERRHFAVVHPPVHEGFDPKPYTGVPRTRESCACRYSSAPRLEQAWASKRPNGSARANRPYFAGSRNVAKSTPTIVFPVKPLASTALR
jgi:hypothetical protein